MRNAEAYIEEISPNERRITSYAYWLTPEGLNCQFTASLLRQFILYRTDEWFKRVFDGATKEEAVKFLEQWELCSMAYWGAPELAKAIVLSDAGRNEALALRAVSLAQKANELPEVFFPKEGIQWAMLNCYLIDGAFCTWVGVPRGEYGHPHNPLSTADAPVLERIPVGKQQETAILNWLESSRHDPLKMPVPPKGRAGVKAECREALCKVPISLFMSKKTFDVAWQRLRDNGAIKDAEK